MKKPKKITRAFFKPHSFHIGRLFPNIVTILGLCLGLSSIRFALLAKWEIAVAFIIIAAFVDGMDGRIARMLGSTSAFGAQLDSLSDLINFGVSPALVLYLWKTHEIRGFGWAITLFFVICCAVRLARYNTELDESSSPEWSERFFVGVPAPAGALLSLFPMVITFQLQEKEIDLDWFFASPLFIAIFSAIIAVLMVSRIPTFSVKKLAIKRPELVTPTLIGIALLTISLIVEPWMTMPILTLIYAGSIPVSVAIFYKIKYNKKKRQKS